MPGHADIKGTAPFSDQSASATFNIDSPNRERSGNIGMELLGAVAANINLGISVLAAQARIPVPLQPPDWASIRTAAVNIQADLKERGAERTILTGVSVSIWLCNARRCSPPAEIMIPVDRP